MDLPPNGSEAMSFARIELSDTILGRHKYSGSFQLLTGAYPHALAPLLSRRPGSSRGFRRYAECSTCHDRRSGIRRPRGAWQSGREDAEDRRVHEGVCVVEELLRVAGLLADAVEPHDRAVQLSRWH